MNEFKIRVKRGNGVVMVITAVMLILIGAALLFKLQISKEELGVLKQSYLAEKMKAGWPSDMAIEDIFVDEYCGTYRGSVVVMISDSRTLYTTAIRTESVGGVTFLYSGSNSLVVWKDDSFYTLGEAYLRGFLSKRDLMMIKYIHLVF